MQISLDQDFPLDSLMSISAPSMYIQITMLGRDSDKPTNFLNQNLHKG